MWSVFNDTPIKDWPYIKCVERYANSTHNEVLDSIFNLSTFNQKAGPVPAFCV